MSAELHQRSTTASFVIVHPRFARAAQRCDLATASDYLDLPGEVVSGHRNRHVVELRQPGLHAFLKKEHRVSVMTKVRNWWAGFGAVSLAEREAQTLDELERAHAPTPHWLAYGADAAGRAFVLVDAARGTRELRDVLANGFLDDCARWELARHLGQAVAAVHRAGYTAPDLSAKHVLVRGHDRTVTLLDWPRAEKRAVVQREDCLQALAGLHLSLADHLATTRERLWVLRAYLRGLGFRCPAAPVARAVLTTVNRIKGRRSLRDQTLARVAPGPRLRWVAGERLCVTRKLWTALGGVMPSWLRRAAHGMVNERSLSTHPIAYVGEGLLIEYPPLPRWRCWFGRSAVGPGIVQAGLAFQLRRHGVPVAPVLAFGGRADGGGFMLVQSPEEQISLREWLARRLRGRTALLRRVGRLLRRCHQAGCRGVTGEMLVVSPQTRSTPSTPRVAGAESSTPQVTRNDSAVALGHRKAAASTTRTKVKLQLVPGMGLVRCKRITMLLAAYDIARLKLSLGLSSAADRALVSDAYHAEVP